MADSITRLAPSPTGALHLGNARSFFVNWLMARQNHWRIILRIEDLDGPRIKKGADQQAIEDLRWLGIDWDEGPVYQSARRSEYEATLAQLLNDRAAYPCICTRREASLAASAPHAEDGAAVYPGTCRGRFKTVAEAEQAAGSTPAIRFQLDDQPFSFDDRFAGVQKWENLEKQLGDFVIAKADGTPAYHLAVVVDDLAMNVSKIVRGDDLLDSVPRQAMLFRAISPTSSLPEYWHLPLVVGPDGKRLAKRHGDSRIAYYRQRGATAGRVRALIARWCGIESDEQIEISEMLKRFDISQFPRGQKTLTAADDAWLGK